MTADWFEVFVGRFSEPLRGISSKDFLDLLLPKCRQVVTVGELKKLLESKKTISVKYGIDATNYDVHIGHIVPIMLVRLFQRAGHKTDIVVGDFTGLIGDPSGRDSARRQLTIKQVSLIKQGYAKQISKFIDLKRTKFHFNSKWLEKMKLSDFLGVMQKVSFSEISQRDDFRKRLAKGSPVTLAEATYSTLMALDSIELKSDLEIGGADQLLNFMQTRDLMRNLGHAPEAVLTMPLIEGTSGDGRKMSKSFNNYIAVLEKPAMQFGKIMSIPDTLIFRYFRSFADVKKSEMASLEKFIKRDPMEAKKQLGMFVVFLCHGARGAREAREEFERKFSRKIITKKDEKAVKMKLPSAALEALYAAGRGKFSKSYIRRLIRQGGVRKLGPAEAGGGDIIGDQQELIRDNDVIKVGKLNVFRFVNK